MSDDVWGEGWLRAGEALREATLRWEDAQREWDESTAMKNAAISVVHGMMRRIGEDVGVDAEAEVRAEDDWEGD